MHEWNNLQYSAQVVGRSKARCQLRAKDWYSYIHHLVPDIFLQQGIKSLVNPRFTWHEAKEGEMVHTNKLQCDTEINNQIIDYLVQ